MLDVNWMTREGFFDGRGSRSGTISWSDAYTGEQMSRVGYELDISPQSMRLQYQVLSNEEDIDYKVPLTMTTLPWGGVRRWFLCPLTSDGKYCGRRVSKLYLPPAGWHFGCRHCYGLTYASCRKSRQSTGLWGRMGTEIGMSVYDAKRLWDDDFRWERRMERQAKRNEQRRRRRKARNWA